MPNIINRFATLPRKIPENKGNAIIAANDNDDDDIAAATVTQIEPKSVPKSVGSASLQFDTVQLFAFDVPYALRYFAADEQVHLW